MKTQLLALLLFVATAQTSTADFFDLSPQSLPYAVPDMQFADKSVTHSLAEYKGQRVMLWLFSTWCHTCIASVKKMQEKQVVWEKTGIVILAIRNHKNGGYPGLDMSAFLQKIAPQIKSLDNWVTGEASAEMDQLLNAKKFPDIYFLIDEKGLVQVVSTAPTVTMDKILRFSQGVPK